MGKMPFVTGTRPLEAPEKRSIADIVDEAKKKKAFKDSLHQKYRSRGTPQTRQSIARMCGDRDDD